MICKKLRPSDLPKGLAFAVVAAYRGGDEIAGYCYHGWCRDARPCPKKGLSMAKGYVYILSNPSMPGIVKIGKTTRPVDVRVNELYQTGVPTPFKIEHQAYSPDCGELEHMMHSDFNDCRLNVGREFFVQDVEIAKNVLDANHLEQVGSLLGDFLPGHVPCVSELMLDSGFIWHLSEAVDTHAFGIVDAILEMTIEEFTPIYERYQANSKRRLDAIKARQVEQ